MYVLDDSEIWFNPLASKCAKCAHFNSLTFKCAAFPTNIPTSFLSGEEKHDTVVEGQTGDTVYELVEIDFSLSHDKSDVFNVFESQCGTCLHFYRHPYACVAFPAGIPDSLLNGKEKHNTTINGQKGDTTYEFNEFFV